MDLFAATPLQLVDDAEGGIISNVAACNAAFDPATAVFEGQPLRCASSANEGNACLSDAMIAALKDWISSGTATAGQVVTDTAGGPERTRPMCEYPSWPRYLGTGDIDSAERFICTNG